MTTVDAYEEIVGREGFLQLVSQGTPRTSAAHEIGWTPRRLKRELADRDFLELVEDAEVRRDDGIERVLYDMAAKHNFNAVQMILLNRRPEGWRDLKRIEIKTEGQIVIGVVHSAREALRAAMQENPDGVIAALQTGALGAIEAASTEADNGG